MALQNSINTGTISSGWSSFNTTISATILNPTLGPVAQNLSYYFLLGDILFLHYLLETTAPGSPGSGDYLWNIPSGFQINTSITGTFNTNNKTVSPIVGVGQVSNGLGSNYAATITAYNSTSFKAFLGSFYVSSSDVSLASSNGVCYSWFCYFPVIIL